MWSPTTGSWPRRPRTSASSGCSSARTRVGDDGRQRRRAVHARRDPGVGRLHVLRLPPAAARRSARAVPDDRAAATGTKGRLCGCHEHASIIRSKNAGPFCLTIDVFLPMPSRTRSRALNVADRRASPARTASTRAASRACWWDDRIRGAKVSLLRWSSSSDPFCSDLFGAHLHTPLAEQRAGVNGMEFGILLTSVYDAHTDARQQRREHEELVATAEQLGFRV